MTNRQATRASRAQVEQHIRRQRLLGEDMIGLDRARPIELIVTAAVLVIAGFCGYCWN